MSTGRLVRWAAAAFATWLTGACGGGGEAAPRIAILEPAATGVHVQDTAEVQLGGSVSGAGFVNVQREDGRIVTAMVVYADGQGSWSAEVYGLAPGPNRLTAVADRDGSGRAQARAVIVVTRTGG